MPTDWRCWQSHARSTHSAQNTTANRSSDFSGEPARSFAPLFCGRMNLPPRSCVNISRGSTMTASSAYSRQQSKLTNRRCLRSANLSSVEAACGEGFPQGASIGSRAWLHRTLGLCSAENSGAACGCAIEKVLFAPFRSGTAHIMIVWPVFPARPVPGWAQKRQQGAGGATQDGNQNGCSEPSPWHVTLHVKRRIRIGGPDGPPHHHERSVGRDLRTTQSLLGRSKRIPRSSSSG